MRRRLQWAMVVLALTAFVGACGGGDDDDEATTTTVAAALLDGTAHDGGPGAGQRVQAHLRLRVRRAAR